MDNENLKAKQKKNIFREYAEALIAAFLLAAFIRLFLFSAFTIPSGSMLNTIQIGDYLLVNKLSYGLKLPFFNTWIYEGEGPQYGDIIVFKYPENPNIDYIKRVVGLPGDVMQMRHKQLYRNGKPVQEDYTQNTRPKIEGPLDNTEEFIVPENEYFVMGDNRDNSEDSRVWGSVESEAIYGKAWRIYFSIENNSHAPEKSLFDRIRFSRIGQLVE